MEKEVFTGEEQRELAEELMLDAKLDDLERQIDSRPIVTISDITEKYTLSWKKQCEASLHTQNGISLK